MLLNGAQSHSVMRLWIASLTDGRWRTRSHHRSNAEDGLSQSALKLQQLKPQHVGDRRSLGVRESLAREIRTRSHRIIDPAQKLLVVR